MLDPLKLEELYAAIGSAVWHIQFLEDVLVTYLTMRVKLKRPSSLVEAQEVLAKERRKTLGLLMAAAKDTGLLAEEVTEAFAVLDERNWLVHRSMLEASDEAYNDASRQALIARIRNLTDRSILLKKHLYSELVAWCRNQGGDVDIAEAKGLDQFLKLRER